MTTTATRLLARLRTWPQRHRRGESAVGTRSGTGQPNGGTPALAALPLEELRRKVRAVHEPGHAEYADACALFNSMIQRRPRLVARCTSSEEVIAARAFAREHDLEVAVRSGGHSVTGRSLCDGGIVLDVRGMCEVVVDPKAQIAHVGGGAVWGDVDSVSQQHGLATTGGRVSTTGVAGLTLGGGSGWLERKHGLACDNLSAAQLVTADGSLIRTSADENPELLWALRGGGANFGVLTELEFRLHPLPSQLLAGLVIHPAERGRELLRLFRDAMASAPEELGLAFAYVTAPADADIPERLHGQPAVIVAGMYAGTVEDGEKALAELRAFGPPSADLFAPTSYAAFQRSLDDPPGYRNYWTAEQISDLSETAIDRIAGRSETIPPGPSQLFIVPWGGAIARVGADTSPLAGRDCAFIVHPLLMWEDPADDERMIELGRAYREDLRAYSSGTTYLNFLGEEGGERVRAAFGDRNYDRLASIKARWDPDDVFHGNQNLRPMEAALPGAPVKRPIDAAPQGAERSE